MSRHGFHTFTTSAPVFGVEEDFIDLFYEPADRAAMPRCVGTSAPAKASPSLGAPVETQKEHE